ncbi:hypothetical protein H257_19577 [Aphanomyces astaci]|uniref:AGC-kinase C-terminal domain-containing protein n=1 Tax=Aphanomyces astaci TaxID=112090 RepID=W4F9B1_APHAT|nr:hypothetical protein H257_19577 [Aphanomyces astaci]ETV63504.1 hypothetical protein H257_19577 [Aphanomyces astaci]|eukprot:XP_009847013.1 hypothetical protein H257_19577 [Aphanomyces astaci]
MTPEFLDLLTTLLEKDPSRRLGYLNGIADVKDHAWFRGTNWDSVRKNELVPPILPKPAGDDWVNNFDPQFTEQPHALNDEKLHEGTLNLAKEFAGFDYVRQMLWPSTTPTLQNHLYLRVLDGHFACHQPARLSKSKVDPVTGR